MVSPVACRSLGSVWGLPLKTAAPLFKEQCTCIGDNGKAGNLRWMGTIHLINEQKSKQKWGTTVWLCLSHPGKGPSDMHAWCTKNNKQLEQTNKQKKNSRIRQGWWGKGTYSYAWPGCHDISGFLSIYCLLPGMSLLFVCLFVTTEDLRTFC